MKPTLASAAITVNSIAVAVQGYVTFESPASRYGHYDPDFRQLTTDPYVTSRCATRDASPFPGATTVWHAGSQPCITLKEVGPFQSAAYKVTRLDAAGAPVYVEDFAVAPLGNTMVELHQTLDTQTGLPVFEWCDRDRHHGYDQHDRNCVPRNDLVVAKRRLTLTLPKDVASCKDCTLQLATKVDGAAPQFACANVDVVEAGEVAKGKADSAEAVCESEPAELTRYAAAVASVWAIFAFYSLWKWTVLAYLVANVVVLIVAGILGKREKTRLAEVGDSSDSLPVYDMSEQTSKGVAAGLYVTDPEAPHASLITDNGANGSDDAVGEAQGKRGRCRFSRRAGQCGHGKCEPSALRVGLHMAGPRRARRCMGGLCAILSIGYILTGIIGGLMILHYQA